MKGLYAITDTTQLSSEVMLKKTEEILRAGTKILQYRNKQAVSNRSLSEALELLELCKQYSVPLIINDDIEFAVEIDANGVHLGKDDSSVTEARKRLGHNAIIGVSCYNDLERANNGVNAGANYLAFGACFPSPSKPNAVRATPDIIRTAKQKFNLPVVAIGGITPENGSTLINAGADMLAIISGIYASETSYETTKNYISLFN